MNRSHATFVHWGMDQPTPFVLRTCLFCHAPFPANDALETLPVGKRIAFDPARGRLWLVCTTCQRWTLAPMDDRWEALEELDRATTDRARLLRQTENIALLQLGEITLVRVGRANRAEEAWWRFGQVFERRRKNYRALTYVGVGAVGAAWLGGMMGGVGVFGGWWMIRGVAKRFPDLGRRVRFGRFAWQGEARCPDCGSTLRRLPYRSREHIQLSTVDGGVEVGYRCLNCWRKPESRGFTLRGAAADSAMRRVLAYHHFSGATESEVRDATSQIESRGSAEAFTRATIAHGLRLGNLHHTGSIALEIAFNEDVERRLLEMEVQDLEARWREEEELAAIVDGELTPMSLLQSVARRLT
jgi:hypothetical protein